MRADSGGSASPEQTAIPRGDREYPDECAWCGASPAEPYEVEPARYGKSANGTRVEKRHAITVPACDSHRRRFDADKAARAGQ